MQQEKTVRDLLAIDRTRLANQRTFLAFLRTSIYFVVMGMTVLNLENFIELRQLSVPLFIAGVLLFLTGVLSYFRERRKIEQLHKYLIPPKE